MRIDPAIERPARKLLGYAIRGEGDRGAALIEEIGDERFAGCLGLCLQVAGYIAIDVCAWHWPADSDLRELARRMAAVELGFTVAESDVYAFLARCALGFEPLAEVFADEGKAGSVPVLGTAALLVSYRAQGSDWWVYLEQIEEALESAEPLAETVVPALLLLARRRRDLAARGTQTDS
jgi:hypothetical protein